MVKTTKIDYFNLHNAAWLFLIKNKINYLPVNLDKIISNNNWILLSYENNEQLAQVLDKRNYVATCNGWTCMYKDHKIIFYKSNIISVGQQRFTIAHEIGHLTLAHLVDLDNLTYEKEATMFAARILMPIGVLHACEIKSINELSNICNVSLTAATYRYNRYLMLKSRKLFYTSKLEKKTIKNFKLFIKKYLNR